ncbi:18946_t:CDS:2 [Dentiscutata erythropus]|uniref:18946_t:CDS:1 n=1 Tax=Dentiscutata erythropus TaxID=1348616 RepID=A0A9N9JPZ4_9GLOM|nr:18946_t:CDS:2 [Dentiscutata erythropus]
MSTLAKSSKTSEYQKELSRNRQKRFRDKKNKNNTLFTIIDFEKLKCLLTTEIPTIVIKPLYTNPNLINICPNRRPYPSRIKTLRYDMRRMDQTCRYCKAKFWILEKNQNSGLAFPRFSVCCVNGKVKLPFLFQPPPHLLELYTLNTLLASEFQKNVRGYNTVLACTFFGSNSIVIRKRQLSSICSIYIYDTAYEVENHLNVMDDLNPKILQTLQNILDECNPYI